MCPSQSPEIQTDTYLFSALWTQNWLLYIRKKTAFKIKMWDFKLTVNDRNRTCRSPCKRLLGRAFGRRGEEEMEERRKQRERNQIRVMAEYFIFNQSGKRKEEESASNVKERNRYENLFAWENISSHSVFEERRVIVWIYFFKLKKKNGSQLS